jgi:hypothetical protein
MEKKKHAEEEHHHHEHEHEHDHGHGHEHEEEEKEETLLSHGVMDKYKEAGKIANCKKLLKNLNFKSLH